MLDMNNHPGWEGSNSEIDKNPVNEIKDNTGRYKKYLKNYQIEFVEKRLEKMMVKHGYKLEMKRKNTFASNLLSVNYIIRKTAKKIKNFK